MDRRKHRFKNRTAVTKEHALDFPCANDTAEQNEKKQRDHAAQRGRDASEQRRA